MKTRTGMTAGLLMTGIIVLYLLSGIARALLCPKEINSYEAREAEQLSPLTPESYAGGEYQTAMEAALADQVPLAQYMKKLYNIANYRFMSATLLPIAAEHSDRYFDYSGVSVFDGFLVYRMASPEERDRYLDDLAALRRPQLAACKNAECYLFYIENDHDLDMETGEKSGLYRRLAESYGLPAENLGRMELSGAREYRRLFFKTDHHWNAAGAHEGYRALMALLGCEEPLLEPLEASSGSLDWSGTKAAAVGFREFKEPFLAYRYSYPPMRMSRNGQPVEDLDLQEPFFSGGLDSVSYQVYYGGICGETVIATDRPERRSLLLIGDSYDNAILKLVASHFDSTYSVDLRAYREDMGAPFVLSDYVEAHDIDLVVYDGCYDMFAGDVFYEAELENGI